MSVETGRVPAAGSEPAGPGPDGREGRTSLAFTEEMSGHIALGVRDPRSGGVAERSPGGGCSFRLTISIDDLDRFLADPEHRARAEGWVDAGFAGGRRPVERGWFNLFAAGSTPDRREMRYRLWFTGADGLPRTLAGWKDVHHGPPTRLWLDTSTLFTQVMWGHVPEGEDVEAEVAGAGTLHIQPMDLAATLKSFTTDGADDGVAALARFGRFFVGQLWDVYRPG
ncbi:hypothetical protein Sme01_11670 [Sphaerisporangium melleum]|uniref:Uncharacterized protein n=1 Tax=Sphaerisporangium melleum TaxID=321316 RepID=A0A917RHR3_9ACTN|nr:hypothetical protein [Sphaerisporangium melleum]GGL07467.1 hypothetical protein GCM10007964_57110 [Sphaerisporangium melleum]GII68691.1 hypothetical protein Sme01_11670 [Sphaerisporangium melleum]